MDKVFGMCFLLFPSLLGVYAIEHHYITNISGWGTAETNTLTFLTLLSIGFDFYYTSQWDTSFFWHKTHVLAHLTFLVLEYSALGYLQVCLTQIDFDAITLINYINVALCEIIDGFQHELHSIRLFSFSRFCLRVKIQLLLIAGLGRYF